MAILPEIRLILDNTVRDAETGCWTWTGPNNGVGYARTKVNGRQVYIHRVTCAGEWGPIPQGWHVDHLCRNTLCCNPLHLEAVTVSENVRRGKTGQKTHCKWGHELTPENIYPVPPMGYRSCRICTRRRETERRAIRRKAGF